MFKTEERSQSKVAKHGVNSPEPTPAGIDWGQASEFKEDSVSCKVFLVTPADCKTAVKDIAQGVARHYANEIGYSTLLIDGRIEQSGSKKTAKSRVGLTDYLLQEKLYILNMIRAMDGHLLFDLDLGRAKFSEPARQMFNALAECLDELRNQFEVIVIYCDPVVETPSTQIFTHLADHVLLLVRQRKTLMERIKKSKAFLIKCNAKDISVVLQSKSSWITRVAQLFLSQP